MPVKPIVIKFFAPVIDVTINALMNAVDQKMKQGTTQFILLISSPGGSVIHGLSAYNYLKGLPVTITTHNFGSVDSIGVILFCSGSKRLSVPQARFLLHGVSAGFQNERLEEKKGDVTDKKLTVSMDMSARSTWDSSITAHLDDIPFDSVGKGEQSRVQMKLAIEAACREEREPDYARWLGAKGRVLCRSGR